MNRTWILLLSFVVLFSATNAQKKPFTIADLYSLKTISDPQFSPDGKRIAFVASEAHLSDGKTNADIYVVDADGSHLTRMTENPATDNHPRWSPDGKSLLFLSTRKSGQQAWILPVDGGEPHQVTELSSGVDNAVWVAGGKQIVFTADVYPECGADDSCTKALDKQWESGPLQAHMTDHLMYRHWTTWKDGKRTHIFVFDIDKSKALDLTPGDFDAPAFSLGGAGFDVAPDGKEICFTSTHDIHEAETTNKDIWIVPMTGGNAVNLSGGNQAYDGDPAYSPDGRWIAYRTQTIPTYEADRFRLVILDRSTKQTTVLTETFDNWVNDFQWAPDSKSIYFLADVKGHVPLYNVDLKGKQIREVLNARTIDAISVAPDGKSIAFVRRAVGEPHEMWRVGADGKNLRQLTFMNKNVADAVDIRPAEEMWITSPTGKKIHTFIVKPHNFDPAKKYPLILNVHGGPQSQWSDSFRGDWQVYPGSGYIVAFPNPHGSTGYGQDFTAAISKDWGGKVYQDVMAVADSLAALPFVDAQRMGAMGWSYGGYMMMWLEGHTDRFKAIASMMGVYDLPAMHGATEELWFPEWDLNGTPWTSDLYDKWSPNRYVKNFKTPCLVITGEMDFRVPYTQSLEFFSDLQKMRVPSRLIVFKNDGHWPSGVKSMPFYYNAHLDWFHKYLGGDPAPYDMTRMLHNQAYTK